MPSCPQLIDQMMTILKEDSSTLLTKKYCFSSFILFFFTLKQKPK